MAGNAEGWIVSEFEQGQHTPPGLVSKKINIGRQITTIRLEPALWDGLDEICRREEWTRDEAAAVAQGVYRDRGLTSALRTYLVVYFRRAATDAGHAAVGHGSG